MTNYTKNIGQLPSDEQIFLDHVGHFAVDAVAAARALARAGFAPTPISVQVNPDPAGGSPVPTGTGNVCAMLQCGYVEVLFKTADTPLGRELDIARARYPGIHLAAFAIADAPAWHGRLQAAGFDMQPLVDMRRPVDTVDGEGTAAFSVVRITPGQMPEGRIQLLRHLTEDTVWQPRWLVHPNSAQGLASLTIAVADVAEAAARFARFLGRTPQITQSGASIALDRGTLVLMSAQAFRARWPDLEIPCLPFIGICGIEVASADVAAGALALGGLQFKRTGGHIEARFPADLGVGAWLFDEAPGSRAALTRP